MYRVQSQKKIRQNIYKMQMCESVQMPARTKVGSSKSSCSVNGCSCLSSAPSSDGKRRQIIFVQQRALQLHRCISLVESVVPLLPILVRKTVYAGYQVVPCVRSTVTRVQVLTEVGSQFPRRIVPS